MDTRTDCFAPRLDWLGPLGGWDAAVRWNQLTMEWMTRGWQQWLELATAWPALESTASVRPLAAAGSHPAAREARADAPGRGSGAGQPAHEVRTTGRATGRRVRASRADANRNSDGKRPARGAARAAARSRP